MVSQTGSQTPRPEIRPLRDEDRDGVKDLWARCGLVVPHNDPDADIARARGRETSDILVAGDHLGAIVASVMVGHDGHRGWIYYVAVDPDRRETGLGRAIVGAAETWLRARGVPKAQLMIRETNTSVRDFYAALGWRESPRLVMERWL